ncbi:MAG: SDR family oxidoreductase [Proteobacteria bacterium]|nr:SDR family oxidoreductase [Pseudomonadota bacterium]MBU1585763.1 SDR family oxidoreductase [Pseudomonadota bacterium]MBU2452667.1 SDR family oxidoreductase [Pseudomonadota bacterium]MBU2631394.1 SDR family oxidoreductase [Pseudomonadota bacterium]
MRILILGGTGMLGHTLWDHFSQRFPDTYATIRKNRNSYDPGGRFNSSRIIDFVEADDFIELAGVMKCVRPDFILNCIGVTKRREEACEALRTITLNALLPHKLVEWGKTNFAKVINFSTDCVFNGEQGNYTEESPTNATDFYGKTKALGEIQGNNALTLRSSFIGTELGPGTELLEWFLSQTGRVKGFTNAIYTGLTTLELSRIIEQILLHNPGANGIYNVSSDPISKYALLILIKDKLHLGVDVIPDTIFRCDRSLNSTKFRKEFNYTPPTWETMIDELSKHIFKKSSSGGIK